MTATRDRLIALAEDCTQSADPWWNHPDLHTPGEVYRADLWDALCNAVEERTALVEGAITHREIDPELRGPTAADDARNICDDRVEQAAEALRAHNRKAA